MEKYPRPFWKKTEYVVFNDQGRDVCICFTEGYLVLCATFRKDWTTQTDAMDEFLQKFKMSSRQISSIAQPPCHGAVIPQN